MIFSKPSIIDRAFSRCQSTSPASTAEAPPPNGYNYRVKLPPKEILEYAKSVGFNAPAEAHPANPYHHIHTPSGIWKKVLMVAVPLTVVLAIRVFIKEHEENKHVKEHRPEYVPVEFLRVKRTPFPWGDGNHTLFHNPQRNPVPGVGYED